MAARSTVVTCLSRSTLLFDNFLMVKVWTGEAKWEPWQVGMSISTLGHRHLSTAPSSFLCILIGQFKKKPSKYCQKDVEKSKKLNQMFIYVATACRASLWFPSRRSNQSSPRCFSLTFYNSLWEDMRFSHDFFLRWQGSPFSLSFYFWYQKSERELWKEFYNLSWGYQKDYSVCI